MDHPPKIIPRSVLFGNPQCIGVKISPNGTYLSYLAPSDKGVLNIWLKTPGKNDDRMLTHDEKRGIRSYGWTYDNQHLLYVQDQDGDENWHLYATHIETAVTRDLTPFKGVRAQNLMINKQFPDRILIGLNKRDPNIFDIYELKLSGGALKMVAENPGNFVGWRTDHNMVIRVATSSNSEDGSTTIHYRQNESAPWRDLVTTPFGENTHLVGFAPDNQNLYFETTLGFDTSALTLFNPNTLKQEQVIAQNDQADLGGVMIHPNTHNIEAVTFNYMKRTFIYFDKEFEQQMKPLVDAKKGEPYIVSRTRDLSIWIVAFMRDNYPYSYYHYIPATQKLTFLFTHQPQLEQYQLAPMKPMIIQSRDGLNLVSYLTLPLNQSQNLPMVLLVHGGPWSRDSWGYDGMAQWLANRGYAVLQVNFRASTGFGKKFLNAGNGQWGTGTMQHDLTDGVAWAIEKGIADPKKIAIMGGSYGGYATLAGLTFTPDIYACGVDIVGPSNLKTLMNSIPSYWKPMKTQMSMRVGPVETDNQFNHAISPLFHVDNIKAPLFIGQGKNDPRVKIAESDQIVAAMRGKDLPVSYIVFPDEGHGFARPENRLDFFGRVEVFLKRYIGGRLEPFNPIIGSSAEER